MNISDVSGKRLAAYGSLCLPIKLGSPVFQQAFIVCDICQDGILGQDFLLNHIQKVNYKHLVLLTNEQEEIQCRVEKKT